MSPSVVRSIASRALSSGSAALKRAAKFLDQMDVLTPAEKIVLARNAIFKDLHKGKRAFVIVNGPSLNRQDIRGLDKEITFVVSGFWKHPVLEIWQPTYYSILDNAFFADEKNIRGFYADLAAKVKATTYFIPLFRGYKANLKYRYLDPARTYYIASQGEPSSTVDLTSVVQGFQSVSSFALAQAIYMGCSPIYLLGFDHDYLAYRGVDHHFYEGCVIEGHKNTTAALSEIASYDREMEALLRLWANYRSLKAIAEARGIRVINATEGGYLDVFERGRFGKLTFN